MRVHRNVEAAKREKEEEGAKKERKINSNMKMFIYFRVENSTEYMYVYAKIENVDSKESRIVVIVVMGRKILCSPPFTYTFCYIIFQQTSSLCVLNRGYIYPESERVESGLPRKAMFDGKLIRKCTY
jgi:hypothetical protein